VKLTLLLQVILKRITKTKKYKSVMLLYSGAKKAQDVMKAKKAVNMMKPSAGAGTGAGTAGGDSADGAAANELIGTVVSSVFDVDSSAKGSSKPRGNSAGGSRGHSAGGNRSRPTTSSKSPSASGSLVSPSAPRSPKHG
jgi:hypothetical protein